MTGSVKRVCYFIKHTLKMLSTKGEKKMRKHELTTEYHDHFEYFGNTEIERIRKIGDKTIRHDYIIFDTVDEAMDFFNDRCGEFVGFYA